MKPLRHNNGFDRRAQLIGKALGSPRRYRQHGKEIGGSACLISKGSSSREHHLALATLRLDGFRRKATRSLERAVILPAPRRSQPLGWSL